MDNIILWIMAIAMVLGALDRMFGSRLGLGKQFEEGILAIGALSLSMLGILTLAPVLARLLRPVLVPVYGFLGADPAMFAGSILANDMGGAPLAMELAGTRAAGQLGGLIVGSMLGATVVFSIPVALGILQPEDRPALARGVLAGLLAIAPGAFAGGLAAGFPLGMLVRNLVPIVLFAVLIALGLWRWERAMIRGFLWFGRGVLAVITVGLAAAVFTELTGVTVIPGMAPLEGGVQTVAGIGFVLAEKSLDVFSYDFSVLLAWEIERYDRISYFRGQNASLQRRDIGLLYVQCSSAPHHEFRDCAFSFETSPHDPAQVVCRRN